MLRLQLELPGFSEHVNGLLPFERGARFVLCAARLHVGAVVRVAAFTENGLPITIFDNMRGIFRPTLDLKHSAIEKVLASFVARTGDFLLPYKAVESILPAISMQRALDPELKARHQILSSMVPLRCMHEPDIFVVLRW